MDVPTLPTVGAGQPTPCPAVRLTVGRFEVERELGRGGMGVVYLARDPSLGRPVAVKLLHANDPHATARFRAEAHALGGLSHPNAVRVFEYGDHAGRPYLAMEYIPGTTLLDALADGPLAPRRTAALMARVADAVEAAHVAGVLHRDLKPANVLLDDADTPKLTDFGLARPIDTRAAGLTATNETVGTPGYMAPEQAAGQAADARTDVYGLGATLYECLTGRPPFEGPAAAVLVQVLRDDPVAPHRLHAGVPADLETVCLKCLDKEPGRRYRSAGELAADLGRAARGEPVLARPVSRVGRAVRWGRRNKGTAGIAATALLAVAASGAAVAVQAVRATAARDAEAAQRVKAERLAAEAAAVNQFLLDDLIEQASSVAQANAKYAPNPDLTVREAVARAAGAVGQRFRHDPSTAEVVRTVLGDTLRDLGDYPAAVEQYRLAADGRRDRLGADHPTAVALRVKLGDALSSAGRHPEALAELAPALAARRAALDPDHPDLLSSLGSLGAALVRANRPADAVPLFEEQVRARRATLGDDHPDALWAAGNLADAYRRAGDLAAAVPLAEEVLEGRAERLGADHPHTHTARLALGQAYRAAGRLADALPLTEAAARGRRAVFGPTHPHTRQAADRLTELYADLGLAVSRALP